MNAPKKETAHWFKFLPADFLADINVCGMTTQEVGIYWLLICYCWGEGSLPDDHDDLAALTRLPVEGFKAAWERRVKRSFTLNDQGRWVSPWLEGVRAEKAEFQEKKRIAANTRWKNESRTTKGKIKKPLRGSKVILSQHANAHALQVQSTRNANAIPIQNNTVQEQGGAACDQTPSDVATHDRGEGVRVVLSHDTDPLPPIPPTPTTKSANQHLAYPEDLSAGEGVWGRGGVPRSTNRAASERKRRRRKRDLDPSIDELVAQAAAASDEPAFDDDERILRELALLQDD